MSLRILVPALAAALLLPAAARADGDATKGKQVFMKCAICHSPEPGQNKVGPSLAGVVGRKSATVPNFNYSEAMKKADKTWDEATLDANLSNPRGMVPNSKMIFVGLKDEADRANVIAYLGTLK
jgi:cytochrome c